jgi:hypothetical protein
VQGASAESCARLGSLPYWGTAVFYGSNLCTNSRPHGANALLDGTGAAPVRHRQHAAGYYAIPVEAQAFQCESGSQVSGSF